MDVWIWHGLSCWISNLSIYYAPELDIRVKSNDHFNFSRSFIVQFQAPRYIMGLKHTPGSKVMAIRICRELRCSISSVSIYYAPESDIRGKSYDYLNFSRAYAVYFQASWYIMGLNHTSESNVMAVWICRELPCSISSVSIYYASELDIRVKSIDHLNYLRPFLVHFLASRYVMGLTHTPESNVMAVQICRELPCVISIVLIYFVPELDIRVKSNDHLNISRASVVHFRASRYFMGLTHTPESKVMAVWI